jgi:hypothetical protein
MNRRSWRRIGRRNGVTVAAVLVVLGASAALYAFGAAAAGAADGDAAAAGVLSGVPPPPEPCAAGPGGPCSSCTSDVPGASEYENSLPVPSPKPGFNYVVQLVNESDKTILAGVDAAHRGASAPGEPVPPPVVVLPREGTWVMLPKGAPNNGNVLTVDVPPEWEDTVCPQDFAGCAALGPRFWPRTGCAYDIAHNLAQCETGSCGDAYDCGKQALRTPPLGTTAETPASITEWTFNSVAAAGYEYPDISLVDGVSITVDIQALGPHCASKPGVPAGAEPNWLSENQPLATHGVDLRDPGRCIPSFRLTRGEKGQIIQGGGGDPNDVIACFTNCGRYEYPQNPGADCNPDTDPKCKYWKDFCCYAPADDPNHVYGGSCTTDDQCHQAAGCWDLPPPAGSFCACRAFIKEERCAADVCTHPNPPNTDAQPPFGHCSDVTDDATACIGDDTVHAVFPGGYTWPNDPQVYGSDARAYRVIFAPGWSDELSRKAPITDSKEVPLCSSLPAPYGYEANRRNCAGVIATGARFAGALLSPPCQTQDDCPIIPGSNPPAHEGCYTPLGQCAGWACEIADGGPVSIGTILCQWPEAEPSPTATMHLGTTPPPPARSTEDDSCAIVAPAHANAAWSLLLPLAALLWIRGRPRRGAQRLIG